jgi:hypothetical protein
MDSLSGNEPSAIKLRKTLGAGHQKMTDREFVDARGKRWFSFLARFAAFPVSNVLLFECDRHASADPDTS